MNTYADKTQQSNNRALAETTSNSGEVVSQLAGIQAVSHVQQRLQNMANQSLQNGSTAQLQAIINDYSAQQRYPVPQDKISTGFQYKPIQRQLNVIQREESLAENISRILANRKIYISDEEADSYAEKLTNSPENTEIQVFGHHRALKKNAAGTVSSIKRRPPSSAVHMRADAFYGPMEMVNASMVSEGRFPIAGGLLEQDVTIRAADLTQIGPRGNLRAEMGGSAAQMSGIEHSEWLHAVAHSLGGDDKGYNLAAGPHSLNTAMIPFETAVKQLVFDGKVVDYSVTFFTSYLENDLLYITHVEIGIDVNGGGRSYWTLHVDPSRISDFINGGVLAEIQEIAHNFVSRYI